MAQKAVRSEASSPNFLGPEWDWPEVPEVSGGMSSPNHTLLATGKMGRGRE